MLRKYILVKKIVFSKPYSKKIDQLSKIRFIKSVDNKFKLLDKVKLTVVGLSLDFINACN